MSVKYLKLLLKDLFCKESNVSPIVLCEEKVFVCIEPFWAFESQYPAVTESCIRGPFIRAKPTLSSMGNVGSSAQDSLHFYPHRQSRHLYSSQVFLVFFSSSLGSVSPSQLLSISLSLPPCQISTENAVPASLLSADGEEEEEGEGKTGRKGGGENRRCIPLLHQRQHHCHASFRHRKTTRKIITQQS